MDKSINLRYICISAGAIWKISNFLAFVIGMVSCKMILGFLLAKINSASYRLQVRMVSVEVSSVIMCNICVTTCTIDSVYSYIWHYFVSITRDIVTLPATKLVISCYLRHWLSSTNSHLVILRIVKNKKLFKN